MSELFTFHWNRDWDSTPLGFISIFAFPFPFPIPIPCSVDEPLNGNLKLVMRITMGVTHGEEMAQSLLPPLTVNIYHMFITLCGLVNSNRVEQINACDSVCDSESKSELSVRMLNFVLLSPTGNIWGLLLSSESLTARIPNDAER